MLCDGERAAPVSTIRPRHRAFYILCMRVPLRARRIYVGYFIIATAKIRVPAGRNGRPRGAISKGSGKIGSSGRATGHF